MPRRFTAGIGVLATLVLAGMGVTPLQAQFNIWTNTGAGKWEVASNWSLGTPPGTNDFADNIYNGGTVTIDSVTSGSFSNTMTINAAAVETPELLDLSNAGTSIPLHILNTLDVLDDASLIVSNSALQVDGVMTLGNDLTGHFELDSGWAQFGGINLGGNLSFPDGILNMHGGTLTVLGTMTLASGAGSAGDVFLSAGTIIHGNNPIVVGGQGPGQFVMTGGFVQTPGFQIGNAAGSQGTLSVSGGTILVSSNILVGNNTVTNPCSVTVNTNGALRVTNASHNAYIDVASNGSLTLNGGTLQVDTLILTNGGSFTNHSGILQYFGPFQLDHGASMTLSGGALFAATNFSLGTVPGSSGTLNVTAGNLTVTNAPIQIGPAGSGVMTQSGGTVTAQSIQLGGVGTNGSGNLTLTGGHTIIQSNLNCNFVVVNGGDLDDGTSIIIGTNHDAQMQVQSGTVRANVYVGFTPGYTGTYTQSGGNVYVTNFMIVGDSTCGALGVPTLSSGFLYITNTTHTAVLDIRYGTFVLNPGGTLVVDTIIITNGCGHFINNGGTLITNNAPVLGANLDATGAGLPNGWKQAHGLDPLSNSGNNGAAGDPDGDGMNNLQEYKAGTDPQSAASVFKVVGVVVTNNNQDVRLDWTVVGGHSYVVQTTTGSVGSIITNFADVSPVIAVGGTGEGQTNWVHVGGAGNATRYYRVRLGP